jgi:molybdopterin synthase catalytic subunit
MFAVRVQREDFDPAREGEAACEPGAGALVTFVGICRDEGGLSALELEHYPGMAESEIESAVAEARTRWPLIGAVVVHRYGKIPVGERIVVVATASSHRAEAFAAAEFLMDYLKTRAPFWKREWRSDGARGEWVEARGEDESAARRWRDESAPTTHF